MIKKNWKYLLTAFIAFFIGLSFGPSQSEVDEANSTKESVEKKMENLVADNTELQKKVEEATPWFKMKDEERKQKEEEAKAAEEKRLAEEQAKKEAEEKEKAAEEERKKQEAEAKEKQGYNTGITYDQLARTPDDYIFEKVKFSGKVIQVIEGDGKTQIRFAVNSDYDTVLFGEFDTSIVSSRILEDDQITIFGTSAGLITYDSTMGGKISIPGVSIEKIDQ